MHELDEGRVVAVHGENDGFDSSVLVSASRATPSSSRGGVCDLLPVDELLHLSANNRAFAEHFDCNISLKLGALRARQEMRELQPAAMARVPEASIQPPLLVEAARLMSARKATSLLVRDGERVGRSPASICARRHRWRRRWARRRPGA